MIPILFDSKARDFSSRGLGPLTDAIACNVVEERNGTYELDMEYPIDGIHFNDIGLNKIIYAIPSPYRRPQPFRIYKISRAMRGKITINAQHISYDLSGIAVLPFTGHSVADVMNQIKQNSVITNNFEFSGSSGLTRDCVYTTPNSARQILGGMEGSILDVFGGEYEFDGFNVIWRQNRGANRGVTIRYGKNLLDITQDVDISGAITGVIPYWADSEGGIVVVGDRINLDGKFSYEKVIPLDLSEGFENAPSKEQLNQRAKTYIEANYTAEPDISCDVSFALIEQSEEYKEFRILEQCDLCDTVTVVYPDLGVNSTAKIIKVDTDVLHEKYNSVAIGTIRANIAQTIIEQQKQVDKTPTKNDVSQLVRDSLDKITGADGGSVRLLDTNGDGEPDTLYIADNSDPKLAKQVWRFNYLGWAASNNGYNGPFTMGATLEKGLLANFVTAANLVAGTIKSQDGKSFFLDLDTGELRMNALQLTVNGSSISNIVENEAGSIVESAVDSAVSPLESRLSKAESTITVHSNQIATKVSEGDVSSLIDQKADSIRMKADTIQWESENSSMSADGTLTCKGANINGDFRAEKYGNCFTTKNGYSPILLFSRDNSAFGGDYNWVALSPSYINIGDSYGFDTDEDFIKNFDNIKAADDSILMIRRAQEAEGVMIRTTGIQVYNPNGGAFGNGYTGTIASNKSIKVVNGIVVGSV